MTYRDSFLSIYQPTNNNSSPRMSLDSAAAGADLPAQFEEELPATTPVFEGHLYLRTNSKQWDWRLFRFDGTSFICLSSRKVKLPPNTHLDAPITDLHFLKTSPSLNASFTSPLLATPKNKTQQTSELINNNKTNNNNTTIASAPVIASYYQLPKWSVDIVNISAVSVLKPKKKSKLSVSTQKPSKCFCIRTFTGECYIMKAAKQKDLERWLFVLTKMWKFTHAMRSQLLNNTNPSQQQQLYNNHHPTSSYIPLQQQPNPLPQHQYHHYHHQQQQQQQQQQQYPHHPYHPTTTSTNHMMYSSSSNNLLYHQHQQMSHLPPNHDDSISLSQLYKRPQHRALTATNSPLIYNHHPHPPHPQHKNPLVVTNGSTPSPAHLKPSTSSGRIDNNSIHDKNYVHPILSVEKTECIDAWRKSLSELMASDPQLQVSTPPPIESIPEDDQVSIISDMTSISHRQPNSNNLRRRISVSSSISKRSLKSNKIKPRDNNNNTIMLKKKRSDDVKNWIEPRKSDNNQKNKIDNNNNNNNENMISSPLSLPQNMSINNNNNENNKVHPQLPSIDTYQVNYFQDCTTPARSTLSSPFTNNSNNNNEIISHNDNSNNDDAKKSAITLNQNAKYYGSTAAKSIKIVNRRSSSISSLSSTSTSTSALSPKVTHEVPNQIQHVNTATSVRPTSSFTSSSHDMIPETPLEGGGGRERRSLDHHRKSSSLSPPPPPSLYSPTSMMIESPLQTLSNVNRKSKDEDEISLADLQRSLKRASLQNNNSSIKNSLPFSTSTITHHTGGTTTTTSTTTTTNSNSINQQQSPNFSFRQSTSTTKNNNNNNGPSSIVVAPAIPPMPSKSRNSLLSIPFYNNNNDNNNDNKHSSMKLSKNHKESMKLNRPHSWMPSFDHQQKIVQQPSSRQSMQMDNTVQW